ncbi:hypothetical protein JNM87_01630 [Candidatus Saccharibacteria bacterium]|nr:hypothetical protein [Candidatus Saccharibacteria bacterium]
MKRLQSHPQTQRERKDNTINQKWGLLIVLLVFIGLIAEQHSIQLAAVAISLALIALIGSFVQGYRRADELEKIVQLKASAISFVGMLSIGGITHVLSLVVKADDVMSAGELAAIGVVLHMLVLPRIAKKNYEK